MDDMQEIVQEFLVESYENLDQLDQDLIALESEPDSRSLISSIFRTVHTIKGTSGFLGMSHLEALAHSGENLLSELRDGVRKMDRAATDVLLLIVDKIREMLASIEAGTGDNIDAAHVFAAITALQEGVELPVPAPVIDEVDADEQLAGDVEASDLEPVASGDEFEHDDESHSIQEVNVDSPLLAAPPADQAPAKFLPAGGTPALVEEDPKVEADSVEEPSQTEAAAPAPTQTPATPAALANEDSAPAQVAAPEGTQQRSAAESSVRVDVDLLDSLMRQVGELVLVRNQIDRMVDGTKQTDLLRATQRLNLISGDLQEGVMKTRMQPIDHLWSKMPRVVRDLARQLGREVTLAMEGRDTELDRSLLEAVKDPLTHLVRNAVDHGIESPETRLAAGKSETGTVTLRAYHSGGQVVVEISDDGAGIDADAVGRTAIKRGLRTHDQVAEMSPAEIRDLLFLPGFSTAQKVTSVSGRGVGMDVVRSKIEAIGGSVDLDSIPGSGTTWRLRIPLTLAIMPTLTVECGGEVFAIAQVNLLELVAIEHAGARQQIEYVGDAPVFRLRGALLPLVSLSEQLGLGDARSGVVAVLSVDGQRFGLIVDHVLNTEEIVVKAVSSRIKQIGLYSGATVLGDGTVALILDVQAVARRALLGETLELLREENMTQAVEQDTEKVLVVATYDNRRVALPLGTVSRLEHIESTRVEHVGANEVVQYRGSLAPVARLSSVVGAYGTDPADELVMVIVQSEQRRVALLVSRIVDIVGFDPNGAYEIGGVGLTGSVLVAGQVTELLDMDVLMAAASPIDELDDARALAGVGVGMRI